MKKKYIFFDIDGTLTDKKTGEIVESAFETVHKLEEAGHFVSINTGRAAYKAEWFRAKYDFDNMVCNGGHGIFYNGKMQENRPIDRDMALRLYHQADDLGYGLLFSLDDSYKVYGKDFKFYDQVGLRNEPTKYIIDDAFDPDEAPEIFKMYIPVPPEKEAELTCLQELSDYGMGYIRFDPKYLCIQVDEKKAGILRMLEYAGGSIEDVVVFGDDYNDMDMFDPDFYCIAMGNACQPLKNMAGYVTDANVDDGIYNACVKHGWIK